MTSPNWYFWGGSKAREFVSLLHIPYTSMVLAYVVIGTVLAPTFNLELLGLALIAYFLGLGVAAHAIDQASTTGTRYVKLLNNSDLAFMTYLSLTGAVAIGIYAIVHYGLSLWLIPLIALNVFFAFAYPRGDWFGGQFHSDAWFSISWGMLPFFTAYFANSTTIAPHIVLIGLILTIASGIEITLSRWVRRIRACSGVSLHYIAHGPDNVRQDTTELINPTNHVRKPELALKLLVVSVDLLAIALLLMKLGV
jgi:hypothetical protein